MIKLSKENKAILSLLNAIEPDTAKVIRRNINYGNRLHKAIIKHVELSGECASSGGSLEPDYFLNTASGMIEELKYINSELDDMLLQARVTVGEYLIGGSSGSRKDWFDDVDSSSRRHEYRFDCGSLSSLELDGDDDNPF